MGDVAQQDATAVEYTRTEHRDGRGHTHAWSCGCKIVVRPGQIRRTFCNADGVSFPEEAPRG